MTTRVLIKVMSRRFCRICNGSCLRHAVMANDDLILSNDTNVHNLHRTPLHPLTAPSSSPPIASFGRLETEEDLRKTHIYQINTSYSDSGNIQLFQHLLSDCLEVIFWTFATLHIICVENSSGGYKKRILFAV